MSRRVSKTTIWVAIFMIIVAVHAVSAFAQTGGLVGTWSNGSVGIIQYANRVTGATKPGRGSTFSYKFNANGSYEFVGYMESTMYNCTTTLFNHITGRYSVGDGSIELNPARDLWRSTNSCAASGNKQQTKAPTKKSLNFEVRKDDWGRDLLCVSEAGGQESCYRREEKE